MKNNTTDLAGQTENNPTPKKIWKSPELVVISPNEIGLNADTWPGTGSTETSKAPALYKRVKKILPFKKDE